LQFLEKYLLSKGYDFKAFFVFVNYSGSEIAYISLINFFDNEMNVTLVLNSSPEQSESFIAQKNTIYNVSFSVNANNNYNLNVKYEENEKNIKFSTNKPSYTYFFDLTFISDLGTRRWEEIKEIDI
jgi:PKD repeat protein